MKDIRPVCPGTRIRPSTGEWLPHSFGDFLTELQALKLRLTGDRRVVFRGHRKAQWLLDSTFVRSCKAVLFGISEYERWSERIRHSRQLHLSLLNLYLLKFGVLSQPSEALFELERSQRIDPWYEYMKRVQQHPEEGQDGPFPLKGTNILDWTESSDVALFFANEHRGEDAGAVYVCDATATGKTLQVDSVDMILTKMDVDGNNGKALGVPLMFHPRRQILNQRAKNQQAIYFAQMDLRVDLEIIWRLQEREMLETIFVKLILPAGTAGEVEQYLVANGITRDYLFPQELSGGTV